MEQILFLVLLAIVGLVRWISSAAEERRNRQAEKRTGTPAPNTPIQRAPAETEEERIRRFMEALGVPTAPAPPQAQPKQPTPPPPPPRKEAPRPARKTLPVDPFPSPRGGLPIPPVVAAPAPPPPPQPPPLIPPRPSPTPAAPPLLTRETTVLGDATTGRPADFDVRDIDAGYEDVWRSAPVRGKKSGTADPAAAMPATLAARLRNREALRDAIILREVFGPPRSMQPLEPEPRGLI